MTELTMAPVATARLARDVIATHSKSFALASRLLPAHVRNDVMVLYAWCRRVDDIVDGAAVDPRTAWRDAGPATHSVASGFVEPSARPRSEAAAHAGGIDRTPTDVLAQLKQEVEAAYRGDAVPDPLLAAFGDVVRARNIPPSYPAELLRGMAMDLDGTPYETMEDVVTYAWRVAGVVGLMMCHIIGIDDAAAVVPAVHLGIAMQLTNICRDVAEDWQRGRLYVPNDVLARYGAGGLARQLGRPASAIPIDPLRGAVRELLAIADRYYRSADRGMIALPWRAAFAVRSARSIYAAIGSKIKRLECDVSAGRAVVATPQKLAHVATAAMRVVASAPQRVVRRLAGRRHQSPNNPMELADVPRV